MADKETMRFRLLLLTLTVVGLCSGWLVWALYENQPGQAATPPRTYPESGKLPRLLLFLHPRCSCSRATLAEFIRLKPELAGIQLEIVVTGPTQLAPPEFVKTLRDSTGGVQVSLDSDGHRRDLYQAWTSGQVITYDDQGRLGYYGGLTASRGQVGPSHGQQQLRAWLQGQPVASQAVFGCPLVGPDEMCAQRQGTARRSQ